MSAPLPPDVRVLPTLNADGSRRRVRPQLFKGRTYRARFWVAWFLMALFVVLPLLRVSGKPLVLLDVARREFTLFGRTFLATESVLLMLLLLAIFVAIFWVTALVGRAWCGWGCPQTVYLEFLYRPIERWFEGSRSQQLKLDRSGGGVRRLLKNAVFLVLSLLLANVFLAYFVGVEALAEWAVASPFERPGPFLVMTITALLVFFDFAYFREQMCTVICPYARLQSVMLDQRSLIIGYDVRRGEPRSKGKPLAGAGDCVDCGACVRACPTGIDIRNGLQLECTACAQCVDACDSIMVKVDKPTGLIRYATERALSERVQHPSWLRPRIIVYPLLFGAAMVGLLWLGRPVPADVTVLRGLGAPYVVSGDSVRNQIRVKVTNRTDTEQAYRIVLVSPERSPLADTTLIAPESPLRVKSGQQRTTTVFVIAPRNSFVGGTRSLWVVVKDASGFETSESYKLIGPKHAAQRPLSASPKPFGGS